MELWRAIGGSKGSPAMDGVRELDLPTGRWVNASDDDFSEVSAAIGRKTVQGFKVGCVVEAAAAWARVFVPRRDVIPGSDGNEWALEREFTFDLWVEVLLFIACPRARRRRDRFWSDLIRRRVEPCPGLPGCHGLFS